MNASFSLGELGSAAKSGTAAVGLPLQRAAHWDDQFVKLLGPEIYRRRLDALTPGGLGLAARMGAYLSAAWGN